MRLDRFRASAGVLLTAGTLLAGGSALAHARTAVPVPPPPADATASARGVVTDHVVVISIDGLRPDAIERFGAQTLLRLMREGSYTLNAKTIMPSRTLPSHTSMLTGEEPDQHGITWNRNELDEHGHDHPGVPTVFAQARSQGFRTAAFFSKGKFNHLAVPNSLDHAEVPEGNGKWKAARTVATMERYLAREQPNLLFVHLMEPDAAGHTFSWMSWPYGRAVRKADAAVGRILQAADRTFGEGRYTVIVTADHGGSGWDHGSSDPRDVTIPWIVWGEGVEAGGELADGVRTMDTAATALWLLGVPEGGVGEPVRSAFDASAESRYVGAERRGVPAGP